MRLQDVIEEIRLMLTGQVLDLELNDSNLTSAINKTMRELNRYWDETTMVTVPYASCIDLTNFDHNSIAGVYRADGYGSSQTSGMIDPIYANQWSLYSNGGTMYNLQDFILNMASWTTLMQIKNTISTDLSWEEDKHNNKLYINNCLTRPDKITISYIPVIRSVEDIKSPYWQDILVRLSIANTKEIIGRIRSKFVLSNAPYQIDTNILTEGIEEQKELREKLERNSNLIVLKD